MSNTEVFENIQPGLMIRANGVRASIVKHRLAGIAMATIVAETDGTLALDVASNGPGLVLFLPELPLHRLNDMVVRFVRIERRTAKAAYGTVVQ